MLRSESDIQTLVDLYRHATEIEKPDLLNYKHRDVWHPISTRDFDIRVRETAMGLYALGVRAGDHVGLLSENRPEWTIADLATLNCGAADVPIYSTQSPKQVNYILNDADVEVSFISNYAQYRRVREALDATPRLRTIIAFDSWKTNDARVISLDELRARGREIDAAEPQLYKTLQSSVTPDSLATIIYTSGTTGEAKGVMLSHGNIVANLLSCSEVVPFNEVNVVLSFLPLSHIFERMGFYMYLYRRATIYYAQSIDHLAQNMLEVRPHFLTSVPRLFEKIYARAIERAEAGGAIQAAIMRWAIEVAKEWAEAVSRSGRTSAWLNFKHMFAVKLVFSKWQAATGGRIRYFISGGAPLAPDLARVFYGAGMPILQGYGLTESSPVITINTPTENRLGSVGRPVKGVEVRIAMDGEILCAGPNVMRGYYHKPAETAAALERDPEGRIWLHTGDMGTIDIDGYLFIIDRKKDLLKTSGGKYIAPQPIEDAIRQSQFISQVVVIGNERKFPAALIVPNLEALRKYAALKKIKYQDLTELLENPRIIELFEKEVAKYTADLSQFEKIKAIALIDHELTPEGGELTQTLKIRRHVVAEKYKHLIDQIYAAKE